MSGNSEPPLNPALRDLVLSSGFLGYIHACGMHITTHIHINKMFFNLLKIEWINILQYIHTRKNFMTNYMYIK